MEPNARGFRRYRELVLVIVFLVIASQELLEMWLLEPRHGLSGGRRPLSVHLPAHVPPGGGRPAPPHTFIPGWAQRTPPLGREGGPRRPVPHPVGPAPGQEGGRPAAGG